MSTKFYSFILLVFLFVYINTAQADDYISLGIKNESCKNIELMFSNVHLYDCSELFTEEFMSYKVSLGEYVWLDRFDVGHINKDTLFSANIALTSSVNSSTEQYDSKSRLIDTIIINGKLVPKENKGLSVELKAFMRMYQFDLSHNPEKYIREIPLKYTYDNGNIIISISDGIHL